MTYLAADPFVRMLGAMYRDAQWSTERLSSSEETRIAFRCRAHGAMVIDDIVLHQPKPEASALLWRELDELYFGSHHSIQERQVQGRVPVFECPRCHVSSPLLPAPYDNFEYSERMAVRWMERAETLRKAQR